jgi:hypothetical protein
LIDNDLKLAYVQLDDNNRQYLDDIENEGLRQVGSIQGQNYRSARLKFAFCILAVTNTRVSKLLLLFQFETLFRYNWIIINRSKRGLDQP